MEQLKLFTVKTHCASGFVVVISKDWDQGFGSLYLSLHWDLLWIWGMSSNPNTGPCLETGVVLPFEQQWYVSANVIIIRDELIPQMGR